MCLRYQWNEGAEEMNGEEMEGRERRGGGGLKKKGTDGGRENLDLPRCVHMI